MERLTDPAVAILLGQINPKENDIYRRLADYENTGLEPAEINKLLAVMENTMGLKAEGLRPKAE